MGHDAYFIGQADDQGMPCGVVRVYTKFGDIWEGCCTDFNELG